MRSPAFQLTAAPEARPLTSTSWRFTQEQPVSHATCTSVTYKVLVVTHRVTGDHLLEHTSCVISEWVQFYDFICQLVNLLLLMSVFMEMNSLVNWTHFKEDKIEG